MGVGVTDGVVVADGDADGEGDSDVDGVHAVNAQARFQEPFHDDFSTGAKAEDPLRPLLLSHCRG